MVVAVIAMRVMQPTVNEIVDVISVRHLLVTAPGAVLMTGVMSRGRLPRRAIRRMPVIDRDPVLVDVTLVGVVQVPVVQVVGMPVVPDRHVPAVAAMFVIVARMDGMLGVGHVAPIRERG